MPHRLNLEGVAKKKYKKVFCSGVYLSLKSNVRCYYSPQNKNKIQKLKRHNSVRKIEKKVGDIQHLKVDLKGLSLSSTRHLKPKTA